MLPEAVEAATSFAAAQAKRSAASNPTEPCVTPLKPLSCTSRAPRPFRP